MYQRPYVYLVSTLVLNSAILAQCSIQTYVDQMTQCFERKATDASLPDCPKLHSDSLSVDGALYLAFLSYAVKDSASFRTCVVKLVGEAGFLPDRETLSFPFSIDLFSGAYSTFYWQTVDSLLPRYLHLHRSQIIHSDVLKHLYSVDQTRMAIYDTPSAVTHYRTSDSASSIADDIVTYLDSLNFEDLLRLSRETGELPLSDKYGWSATGNVRTIVLHRAKNPGAFIGTWRLVWPYVLVAMERCRVGDQFLRLYDISRYQIYGEQWFGTWPDIPICGGKDPLLRQQELLIE